MPEKKTTGRAQKKRTPSTKAGEYVHEEIHHVREGKHGARSSKQAIAIGLSKARRAGVNLPPPPGKKSPKATHRKPSPARSRATRGALKREGSSAASHRSLSRHAHKAAEQRGSANRRKAAQKAVRTKGANGRKKAAMKAGTRRSKA
jgi:Family of unknown function (DUF6496)